MSSTIGTEDLRSIKTKRALHAAMFVLLKRQSFKKITVKGLCEEALVSRAAFYAHFIDKYDLLEHWMPKLWPKDLFCVESYEEMEQAINGQINENAPIFKNLFYEADNETVDILFSYILSTMNQAVGKKNEREMCPRNVVVSNFYAGGMISYLLWQIKNKFPPEVPMMNRYLYEMLQKFQGWQPK